MRKRAGLVIFFLFSLLVLVFAEDVDLEKIVVTPSRTEEGYGNSGRKVDIVTEKNIERSGSGEISGVLTDMTSVNISDYGPMGNSKTIRMRGSTASQVLVLMDGVPLNNPRDGTVDLNNIPLDNIEKIEVLHGPASNLYGSQAMGGTVNILTKKPPKQGQKMELFSSFGTYRTYVESLTYGGKVSSLGYLVSGGYRRSEGSRANSEFDSKDINIKFDYKLNDANNLFVNSGFYKSRAGSPGPIENPDIDDKQKDLKNFADLNWVFKPDPGFELRTRMYNNYERLEFLGNSMDSIYDISPDYKAVHTTKVRGTDIQLNKRICPSYQLISGFNYTKNMNNSTTAAKHDYTVWALYMENQWDILKSLKINLGARLDDYSNFDTQVNPSLGVLYVFNENNKVHGLVSRSFRAPTFNDLYWPDDGYSKGNPELKPEKGLTLEAGYEAKINKNILTEITYYRNYFQELINWAEQNSVWQPTNIGSAVIDGIEFENKLFLFKNTELDIAYTFLSAKDNKTHKFLIYQPEYKTDCSLKYKDLDGFQIELKGQFTNTRFHDAENTIKVKRFFVFGINCSKKFKSVTYFTSIENLLNRKYQVIRSYPMPGFSITGGLKLDF